MTSDCGGFVYKQIGSRDQGKGTWTSQKCSGAADAYRRPSKGLRTSQIMSEDFSQADTVSVSAVTDTDCTGQV